MEDTSTHPQPHPDGTHQDSHPTPAKPTEPAHHTVNEDHKNDKPFEPEHAKVAAPTATVQHKEEPKDKHKETIASPVKPENKEKHEKKEEHATPVSHETKAENHAQPKPEHKEHDKKETDPQKHKEEPHAVASKTEHSKDEKKEVSPQKPKIEPHHDVSKTDHKADEKKEASPPKAKEEHHADASKAEHKADEKKEVSPQKAKVEPHADEKKEVNPPKAKEEPHADASKAEHKVEEKKEASPQKPTIESHPDASKTDHKADEKKEANPPKAKEEPHTDANKAEHKPDEKKEASPQKPKGEVHVEAKVEVKAHEPEHKTNEAHQVEAKAVASHELDQSSSQPNQTVTEKSPEGHAAEKKSPKAARSSTTKKSPDARASDGTIPTKDRILEVKKMKQAYEDQLKVLSQELNVLAKQERFEKQVLSADISKKSLVRDPLTSQKNSAKLLRPIDRAAFDIKNKPSTVRTHENGESVERLTEGDEGPRRTTQDVKRVNRLKEEPLYLKMEKHFVEKIVCPELEKRKEALKQKREFAKPIELKDLKEHAVKYNQVSKKEILNKQMARMERDAIENEKAGKVINVYKSSMLKHVLEKDEEEKIRDDKKAQEKKQLKERQLQYGKLVKEMYQPKIDEKLRQGLHEKIQAKEAEEAMRKARQAKEPKTDYSGKTWKSRIARGNDVHSTDDIQGDYSSEGKSRVDKFLTKPRVKKETSLPETLPESELPDAVKKINDSLKEKIEKTGSREGQPRGNAHQEAEAKVKVKVQKASPKKKDKSVEKDGDAENNKEGEKAKKPYNNYLDEVRKKRMEQEKNGAKVKYGHWEKVLKNKDMSYQDKVLNILDDVNRIEHRAKLKEEQLKHDHGAEPMDLEGQVTDMYLESIKAKLALIQGLS